MTRIHERTLFRTIRDQGWMRLATLVLACIALLTGCFGSTQDRSHADHQGAPMSRFRVLTYNTLHGLDVGRFWVRPVLTMKSAIRPAWWLRCVGVTPGVNASMFCRNVKMVVPAS